MIELDTFTTGILILFAIVAIMIVTARMYRTYTPASIPTHQIINRPAVAKQPINIVESNRLAQMKIMNMKYENIGDDIIDYNNKPTGLFAIP